jgi:UTP--glucose-1-phosphate uridylyltransferase
MKKSEVKITQAVIPIAGRGKRLIPFTLHQPKALIGIVDRPVIHYIIDEAILGGVRHIVIVVSPSQKKSIDQYLDFLKSDPEWKSVKFSIAVQKEPLGNGHAVLAAAHLLDDAPFFVLWSDDVFTSLPKHEPLLKTLVGYYQKILEPVVVLERVPRKDVAQYGVVAAKKINGSRNFYELSDIVEKPKIQEAPSTLTAPGRYLLTPAILKNIKTLVRQKRFVRGEIWLVDALKMHLENGNKLYGWECPHERFDCGSKMGVLKAQVHFATLHEEFRKEFKKYLKALK